ncbi:hypothetical protein jhhlp_008613 [Lomentospora prolificans]|uniref:Uncharacterized protein n=1 Tax=Lomentospora prolificans TaxID=41688 RepID=A0A2N3MYJ3_9PEZI|nr:hypothetical protein jhhlp_008613 [Lomentospora prolificans]
MDARVTQLTYPVKPQRLRVFQPIGNENLPPTAAASTAHARAKSLNSAPAMVGGLKVNAKRTAFADLSNTTAAQPLAIQNGQKKAIKNEGGAFDAPIVGGKDAFRRPAQRPSKPLTGFGNQAKVTTVVDLFPRTEMAQPSIKTVVPKKSAVLIYNDQNSFEKEQVNSFPVSDAAKQYKIRQYKSQPQLKPEAPILRRTQSRLLNASSPIQTEALPILADLTEALYEDAVEHLVEPVASVSARPETESAPLSIDTGVNVLLPTAADDILAEYQEDKVTSATLMSEPEEYWEEEEDEMYDDQGYTTAHSFRSRGDLTGGVTTLPQPKMTNKVIRELEAAKAYVESTRPQYDLEEDMWDISMVAEYSDEIFEYMRELEDRLLPNAHYMDIQTEIQWSMRSVLMDWLVQVHNRFGLLPETLFLAVNYIDRFLSYKVVSLGKLQLVGATAILVAAKYEEINCPSLQEIVYMVDSGYTIQEVAKAERFMLSMLNYELGWPGPMSFLRRISKADDYDLETRTLAKYFLEVTIMDERFVGSTCSFLAAGAHCMARLMLRKGDWSPGHVHYSGYTWNQLKPLLNMLLDCCQVPLQHHAAIFEKYNDKRFKYCSEFVQDEIKAGFELPSHQPTVFSHQLAQYPGSCDGASMVANSEYLHPIQQAAEA